MVATNKIKQHRIFWTPDEWLKVLQEGSRVKSLKPDLSKKLLMKQAQAVLQPDRIRPQHDSAADKFIEKLREYEKSGTVTLNGLPPVKHVVPIGDTIKAPSKREVAHKVDPLYDQTVALFKLTTTKPTIDAVKQHFVITRSRAKILVAALEANGLLEKRGNNTYRKTEKIQEVKTEVKMIVKAPEQTSQDLGALIASSVSDYLEKIIIDLFQRESIKTALSNLIRTEKRVEQVPYEGIDKREVIETPSTQVSLATKIPRQFQPDAPVHVDRPLHTIAANRGEVERVRLRKILIVGLKNGEQEGEVAKGFEGKLDLVFHDKDNHSPTMLKRHLLTCDAAIAWTNFLSHKTTYIMQARMKTRKMSYIPITGGLTKIREVLTAMTKVM
jgi:hypothetical protein